MKHVVAAVVAGAALLLSGCSAAGGDVTVSDDGNFAMKVTQVKKLQNPADGEVCVIGFELENRSDEAYATDQLWLSPQRSQYYSVLDFPELTRTEGDDGPLSDTYSVDGWSLESWGTEESLEAGATLKFADLYPCADLGSSFEVGASGDWGRKSFLTFPTAKWE